MNDVHCALLAFGQCIGIGNVPLLTSILSLLFFAGVRNQVVPGEELGVWAMELDQLQSILHSHDDFIIFEPVESEA